MVELAYTFAEAISRGWGVAGRCNGCGEVHKLTDAQLAERFILNLDQKLSILRGRLKCACGNKDLVIYTYQAGAMNWRDDRKAPSDMLSIIASHEAELRRMAAAKRVESAAPAGPGSYAAAKKR